MKIKQGRKSIRSKFILYGFKIFAPLLSILALIGFVFTASARINGIKGSSLSRTKSVSLSVKLIQDEIKKIATYISLNNDFLKILELSGEEVTKRNEALWYDEPEFEMMKNLVALNGNVRSFALYPENGVQPFLRGMDGSVNHYTVNRVRNSREYSATQKTKYKIYWCPVQKNTRGTFEVNRYDKIVFYREVTDLKNKKPLCFVAIGLSRESFEDVCRNSIENKDEEFVIFNSYGEILCDTGVCDKNLATYINRNVINSFSHEKDTVSFSFDKFYVSCCKLDEDSAIVCNIIPTKTINFFITRMVLFFIMIFILIFLALFLLLELMSRLINKPLLELTKGISKFAEGDFSQQVQVSSDDEIGDVAKAFNKMVGDINQLINDNYIIKMKESENELASLQAQINPHFLYNTLNSLYWQALDQGNETLADHIFSLSRLFQLVLSRGKQEILVENEFELVEHYLEVQKMRFNTKLQYFIDLDDRIRKQKFSKLLLQPFVENSIEHGFSDKTSDCNLYISGKLIDDNMVFEIKDSGTGMSEEEIQKLFTGDKKVGSDRVGGYAIKNIIDRIKLLYKDRGSVKIDSIIGKGTTVTITVPFEVEKNGEENSDC